MQYGYVELLCAQNSDLSLPPFSLDALVIGQDQGYPSTYYATTRVGPFRDPRCWMLLAGQGPAELHYNLEDEGGDYASAIQMTGDATHQWVTHENHYNRWWDEIIQASISVALHGTVVMVNFVAAGGAIGVLGKTAPSANVRITRMIQQFNQNPAQFFNADGSPKPGLNGQAGAVLQHARTLNTWASRIKVLAYISIIAEGVIYGFETGDWTTSIYNVSAGLLVTAAAAAIVTPAATALVGVATTGIASAGWIAAGSAVSLLGPLAVVAVVAIVVGFGLYWLDRQFDLTGRVADGLRIITEAITEGFNRFKSFISESIDRLGDAIDASIEAAINSGQVAWEAISAAASNIGTAVADTPAAVSQSWDRNVTRPASRWFGLIDDRLTARFFPNYYNLFRR